MSADATVIFIGSRLEIPEDEIEALEAKKHPLTQSARNAGLEIFWANFGGDIERYFLFVGKKIAVIGAEGSAEAQILKTELIEGLEDVARKLKSISLNVEPGLWIQWMPDV